MRAVVIGWLAIAGAFVGLFLVAVVVNLAVEGVFRLFQDDRPASDFDASAEVDDEPIDARVIRALRGER